MNPSRDSAGGLDIQVERLSKHFGEVRAVDDLSFSVQPGRVTGFLGPNGAGKTTTLRMVLGLITPTGGSATIGGHRYAELERPGATVGAALEASGFHPGRSGRNHLRVLARQMGVPDKRADGGLEQVGLEEAGSRTVGGYSLGMRQRLSLAGAMLGDPAVLLLDEPANGLDPEGVAWLRGLLRFLAAEGRTVLVSSHVLAEVAQTVDDVVIISRGRLIRQAPLEDLVGGGGDVIVRSPDSVRFAEVLAKAGLATTSDGLDHLNVHNTTAPEVGRLALAHAVELHELRTATTDLERVFLDLTGGEG